MSGTHGTSGNFRSWGGRRLQTRGAKKIARSRELRATRLRLGFETGAIRVKLAARLFKEPSVWMVAQWQPAGSTVRRYHPD